MSTQDSESLVAPTSETPSRPLRKRLYISHALSTWNSRVFEFGAVLFLSTIFPGTLLPASIYALSRAASAILFSAAVGRFIDNGQRMHVVRVSIVGQRLATALSCILLWLMSRAMTLPPWATASWLAVLSLLACVEKLSSLMNTIAIERDWVIVISQGVEHDLQEMNAQMRRIDLFCKLVGPLSIAVVAGSSTDLAILITLGMTCVSVGIEYIAIAKVYQSVEGLQQSSQRHLPDSIADSTFFERLQAQCLDTLAGIEAYMHNPAFLPSLALSLLYLTVFSFGGQMVTYLLATGLTSTSVGLFRTLSTVLELSATWLAPKVMDRIGPIRGGIWFLNWQLAMVALSIAALWMVNGPSLELAGLLTGVILSRIGLWGFDLSAQMIIQESVEEEQRGTFSATEASVQSMFELLSFASTIVFARPEQFKYPAAISGGAVMAASILYACFVRMKRGHLFHASKCMTGRNDAKRKSWRRGQQGWSQLSQHEPGDVVDDEDRM